MQLVKHIKLLSVVQGHPIQLIYHQLYVKSTEFCSFLKLLVVTLDDKLTFKKHFCNIASFITQNTDLIRICDKTFDINDAILKIFYAFILPCFEYCSLVWCSASKTVRLSP